LAYRLNSAIIEYHILTNMSIYFFNFFALHLATNFSAPTINLSCLPSPILSTPSYATTLKTMRRPSTSMSSLSAYTSTPSGVAAR